MKGKRVLIVLLVVSILLGMGLFTSQARADKPVFEMISVGSSGDPFWAVYQQGFLDAADKLGVDAVIRFSEGALDRQLTDLQTSIEGRPNGIAVAVGHEDAFVESVEYALDMGVPVIGSVVACPTGVTPYLAFIGQDMEEAGYDLGKRIANLTPEDPHLVMPVEKPGQPYGQLRSAGILRAFEEVHGDNFTHEILDAGYERATVMSRIDSYIRGRDRVDAVVGLGGLTSSLIGGVINDLDKVDEIVAGGFDTLSDTLDAIEDGFMEVTVDQQQYMIGFLTLTQLYLADIGDFTPSDVDTGAALVDKEAVPLLRDLSDERIR